MERPLQTRKILTEWRHREMRHPHQIEEIASLREKHSLRWSIFSFAEKITREIPETIHNYNVIYFITLEMVVELLRSLPIELQSVTRRHPPTVVRYLLYEPTQPLLSSEPFLPYTEADVLAEDIETMVPHVYAIAFNEEIDFNYLLQTDRISEEWLDRILAYEQTDEEGNVLSIREADAVLRDYFMCACRAMAAIVRHRRRPHEYLDNLINLISEFADVNERAFGREIAIEIMEIWYARIKAALAVHEL